MTAATVPHPAAPAALDEVLETDTAIRAANYLASIIDAGVRRQAAAQLVAQRRQELALYCQLVRERFGHAPNLAILERDDEVLLELTLLAVT